MATDEQRRDSAIKAARTRWAEHIKRHEVLGVSRSAYRRYMLPKKHPDHRPMPRDVRARFEELHERQRNRKYARKLDSACVEKARVKARKP